MSEIEKMYENAGIKICKRKQGFTLKDCTDRDCKECGYYIIPPFTAEKQISILNFCLKWGQVHILKGIDDEYRIENSCYRQGYQPTIADAIANYINEKWEKLTPEEKQQVKGILE